MAQLVVYTNIENIEPQQKLPSLLNILPQLAPADRICFSTENEDEDDILPNYTRELMSFLNPNYVEVDLYNDGNDENSLVASETIYVHDLSFAKNLVAKRTNHTYVFCVLFGASFEVLASCLLQIKKTGVCEIHSVCAMEQGRGYCKLLIEKVIDYVFSRDDCNSLTIYCAQSNPGACNCYRGRFNAWIQGKNGEFQIKEKEGTQKGKSITRWWIWRTRQGLRQRGGGAVRIRKKSGKRLVRWLLATFKEASQSAL